MDLSQLEDLNIDAINGAEIMSLLGLSSYQLDDPITMNRMTDVIKYLKDVPDKSFFVNHIMIGKNIQDKLSHVWTYIEVLKKREETESNLSNVEKQLRGYSDRAIMNQLSEAEKPIIFELSKQKDSILTELSRNKEEVFKYEH